MWTILSWIRQFLLLLLKVLFILINKNEISREDQKRIKYPLYDMEFEIGTINPMDYRFLNSDIVFDFQILVLLPYIIREVRNKI